MITLNDTRKIETIGEFGQETVFSIENNKKAFRGLVGTLYPDKISAILKELGANAVDSHMMAKNPIPFDISIPTQFDPIFKIRDFGVGMSHDFMMTSYTKAFLSTKDNDNDSIGSLGLGRLSALSLYDSYMATCFQDGFKRNYSVFLNEEGIPKIVFVSKEETTEPNGFLVEIPVSPADADGFEQRISGAYQHYSLKPNFVGRDDLKIEPEKYLITGSNWGIKGTGNQSVAIMGGYRYPIQMNSVTGMNELQTQLLNSGIIMNFSIGDLAIQMNREGLHYNNATIEAIKNKLDSILPEIEPVIFSDFNGKGVFQQMGLFYDLFGYSGKLSGIRGLVKEMIEKINVPESIFLSKCNVELISFRMAYGRRSSYKMKKSCPTSYEYKPENVIYYTNRKTSARAKAKKFFQNQDNNGKTICFLYAPDYAVTSFKNEYDFDLTTLPDAKDLPFDKTIVNPGDKQFKTLMFTEAGWRQRGKNCWEEEELDVDDDIIYVTRSQWCCNEHSNENLSAMKKRLENLTGQSITIFGLTQRQLKLKKENWVAFDTYYQNTINEYQTKEEENIAAVHYFHKHYGDFDADFLTVLDKIQVDKDSAYNKICEEYKILKDISGKIDSTLVNSKIKISDKYQYDAKTLNKKYPLIGMLDNYRLNRICADVKKTLENYIKECDAKIEVVEQKELTIAE